MDNYKRYVTCDRERDREINRFLDKYFFEIIFYGFGNNSSAN